MTKEQRAAQRAAATHRRAVELEATRRATRDLAIIAAYEAGTGPSLIAELTGLSRQQVHLIVRQKAVA